MRYVSTRGRAPVLDFEGVLLAGLATDGGLYVPQAWPRIAHDEIAALRGRPYAEVAHAILSRFTGDAIDDDVLRGIVEEAYGRFGHPAVAPLTQIDSAEWLLELFHGPTLAFKDVAMQVLGRLYDHVLERRDSRVTVIGATSGDTGSAAIEAIQGRERASIFILHPHGRVSEVQRRQMTTVHGANVHNLAIEGTFDDCQALLKAMFNDAAFRDEVRISGVNSINWARIVPQVVYYFTAAVSLGAPEVAVSFCVPSGNFGDVFAGYVAHRMGLPVERLVVASNSNDILTRVLNTGEHRLTSVAPTMSPSMDIQVSSNFERLLFEMHDRDGARVDALMRQLATERAFDLDPAALASLHGLFAAGRCDEEETLATIASVHRETGLVIDPHTAVGVHVARRLRGRRASPMVTLSTAHPAKFPDAVERAIGTRPALPPRLADLLTREERYTVLPNDLGAVMAHVRAHKGTVA
ncbi:MAG: threonine synthase [Ectothiorhodospiraceae bacterium]|nr:threonine synthase [Chromatiales bacterium]MCP5154219.1 threonine synthase [Ectothiorhodospiraceae bacterium]